MGDGQDRRKGRAAERAADALARGGVACAASSPAVRHREQRVRADAQDFVRRFRRTNTPSANAASNPPSRNFPNTAATAATDTRPKPIAVSSTAPEGAKRVNGTNRDRKNGEAVVLVGVRLTTQLGIFFNEKNKLSIWLFCIPKPLIGPLHFCHDISLVINFNCFYNFSVAVKYFA